MLEMLSQGVSWFGIGFISGGLVVGYSLFCFKRSDNKGSPKDEI